MPNSIRAVNALSGSGASLLIARKPGVRVRYLDEGAHAVTQRDLHYQYTGRLTVKLTRSGGVYVRLRAETGPTFNSDHNYTALGLGKQSHTFNVQRQKPPRPRC